MISSPAKCFPTQRLIRGAPYPLAVLCCLSAVPMSIMTVAHAGAVQLAASELDSSADSTSKAASPAPEPGVQSGQAVSPDPPPSETADKKFGIFQPGGAGFKLADTSAGDVNLSAWAYFRYLNQKGLDSTYTDAFGRTSVLDLRNDAQLNKVNLYFKGWIYDPRFRYLLFVWTQNPSQGEPAQVVVGGALSYRVNDNLDLAFGIGPLPGTRSTRGTFPYWLKVDNRTIGDEFFRPSYTTGITATGSINENLNYRVMLGNNLSQLGVSALQLDGSFNTLSGAIWWTPRGDYGPNGGLGDFENHEQPVTTFGVAVTRSREDSQEQPGTNSIENTQLRLSDGTVIFQPDAFGTGGTINRATYFMTAINAGVKHRGRSLEGEIFYRKLSDFAFTGSIPVDAITDTGIQVQASMMLRPEKLQGYVATSKIFGDYGNPWDVSLGVNWFPFKKRLLRLNVEAIYLERSPVGYASVPFAVGGTGYVLNTNLEMYF